MWREFTGTLRPHHKSNQRPPWGFSSLELGTRQLARTGCRLNPGWAHSRTLAGDWVGTCCPCVSEASAREHWHVVVLHCLGTNGHFGKLIYSMCWAVATQQVTWLDTYWIKNYKKDKGIKSFHTAIPYRQCLISISKTTYQTYINKLDKFNQSINQSIYLYQTT